MNPPPIVADLIRRFALQPHPEGGFFAETYRAAEGIPHAALPERFGGDRSHGTAIYYLLREGEKSGLHRICSDEIWHFYLGGPLQIVQINSQGTLETVILGQAVDQGQVLQHVVPAGDWFAATPLPGSGFSFVGCTVSPGFDFADFTLASRTDLLSVYPHARDVILQFTL